MYHTILVPLDGSRFGEHALPPALDVARPSGAALHLVHVHTDPWLYAGGEVVADLTVEAALRKHEQDYLDEVARRVRAVAEVPVSAKLLAGPVADALAVHRRPPKNRPARRAASTAQPPQCTSTCDRPEDMPREPRPRQAVGGAPARRARETRTRSRG